MLDLRPISECYWVEPGRLLAGEHPGHWDESVARKRIVGLLDAGVRVFIDLSTRADGVYSYEHQLARICRDRGVDSEYLRRPLPAETVPDHADDVADILRVVKSSLDSGRRVYVHCDDGVDRTGMVIGCWLVERGFDPEDALDELARRFAAMNKARHYRCTPSSALQAEWVENWEPTLWLSAMRSEAC